MQFLLYQFLYYSGHHFGYLHNMKKEKKVRQYRSRQGRSDKQYESNIILFGISCAGLFIVIVLLLLF